MNSVMEYHAPNIAFLTMKPPSEWMLGMHIPSDYRMRDEASDDGSHEDDLDDLYSEYRRNLIPKNFSFPCRTFLMLYYDLNDSYAHELC